MKKNNIIQNICCLIILSVVISCTNHADNNNHKKDSGEQKATDSKSLNTHVLKEHETIGGWLSKNTGQHVVIKELGAPQKKGEDEFWDATGTFVQRWEYSSLGIILEMESESLNGIKKVSSITIIKPCDLKTSKGIGIGTDESSVYSKYEKLIDVGNSNNLLVVVGSIYGGTFFTLKNKKVEKIFVGAIAE